MRRALDCRLDRRHAVRLYVATVALGAAGLHGWSAGVDAIARALA